MDKSKITHWIELSIKEMISKVDGKENNKYFRKQIQLSSLKAQKKSATCN